MKREKNKQHLQTFKETEDTLTRKEQKKQSNKDADAAFLDGITLRNMPLFGSVRPDWGPK